MKNFVKNHPALEETCGIVVALLSSSFALLAVVIVWLKELISKRSEKK